MTKYAPPSRSGRLPQCKLSERMPIKSNSGQCLSSPGSSGTRLMVSKPALLALAVGTFVAVVPRAQAFVTYTVDNPARNFTLFTYDSPTFITTDTTVQASDLAYFAAPPLNFISQVQFILSSTDNPLYMGQPEIIVDQYSGGPDQSFTGDQFRWFPLGTFTQYGTTPGLGTEGCSGCFMTDSFGFPNSRSLLLPPQRTPRPIGLLGLGPDRGCLLFGAGQRRCRCQDHEHSSGPPRLWVVLRKGT